MKMNSSYSAYHDQSAAHCFLRDSSGVRWAVGFNVRNNP